MHTKIEIIAKEGWKSIGITLAFLILCYLLGWHLVAFVTLIFLCCLLYFYRNFERIADDISEDVLIAPLDGKITKIETSNGKTLIVFAKPICFCGLIRMPFLGNAKLSRKTNGLFGGNERLSFKQEIVFFKKDSQDSQALLRIYPQNCIHNLYLYFMDSKFRSLDRIGFFLMGKAILELHKNIELKVNVGDRVYGGKDVLGYFRQ